MTFTGFPASAIEFYLGLEADNSKEYWQSHKPIFDNEVKAPMAALIESVDKKYQPLHIFRPNRDVRFSKDKSPYKTAIGAVGETERGSVVYVQFSATGLFAASGYYMMAPDQLERYRHAVDDGRKGAQLDKIAAALRAAKRPISSGGDADLKTAPKGYPKDHPRIEWLRRKGLVVVAEFGTPAWIHTARALNKVQDAWSAATALNAWLDSNVGPSQAPPEDRWAR